MYFHISPLYLDHLDIDSNQIDIYIQRSWGTISKGNEIISKHEHMQSHISFAYYLKKDSNDANFVLFDNIERNEIIPNAKKFQALIVASNKVGILNNIPITIKGKTIFSKSLPQSRHLYS